MSRRLKQIFLPVLGMLFLVLLGTTLAFGVIEKIYQDQSRQEISRIVGLIAEQYPEVDAVEIVQILQKGDKGIRENLVNDKESVLGAEILQKYGIKDGVFASQSAAKLAARTSVILMGGLFGLSLALGGYFWWRDRRLTKKMTGLVSYVQDLNERIYDLKLEENSEDELSILTNELYKITVLLREAAESQQKLAENLETALADISHQFKTPLTSLQIMLDEIYEDPEMPAKVRQEFLRLMSQQIQSMSSLATTLLNLARLDNGTFKMHNKTVTVQELFDKVRQNLEILADLRGVELEFGGDAAAGITIDPRWQTEALSNIVKNAIEHSQSGQKVILRAENCPLFLKITVEDQGPGMSAHNMRHVFERFYRVQNRVESSTQKHKDDKLGTSVGIGLAFAKAIIEANSGQITVDSELGKGAKFTVRYFR